VFGSVFRGTVTLVAQDPHPKKVVLLDRCTALAVEDRKQEFAFLLTTVADRKFRLAATSAELRDDWIKVILAAGYNTVAQRAVNAQRFISKCGELLASPAPPATEDGASEGGDGAAAAAASSTGDATSPAVPQLSAQDVVNLLYERQAELEELRHELAEARQRQSAMPTDAVANEATVVAARNEMVERLRERVAVLEDQLGDASREVAEMRTLNSELATEKETLLTRAEAAEERVRRQTETDADVDTENDLDSLRSERDAAMADLDAARRHSDRLRAALEKAEAKISSLEENLERERGRTTRLEERITDLRASRVALDAELKAAKVSIGGASAAAATASAAAEVVSKLDTGSKPPRALPQTESFRPTNRAAEAAAVAAELSERKETSPGMASDGSNDPFRYEWAAHLKDAQALEQAGRLAEAEVQYNHVYQIRKRRQGPQSLAVATAARNLGRVLALQRKFDAARDMYTEAVEVSMDVLGKHHPNTACALTDLAAILREQGHFALAQDRAKRAVEALKASVGPDDVSTATALYNLAGLAKRQGKYDEAEEVYSEALRVFQLKLGSNQGETADTLYQLGSLYRRRKDYKRAMDFFTKAATAYAKAYGEDDRRVSEATRRAKLMLEQVAAPGKSS
jgi:tetratricopeptide (TPR) repeat protein